jgi:hypothetical protein
VRTAGGRREYGVNMSSAATRLDGEASTPPENAVLVSVVIPLEEHRNSAERSIQAWCAEQTLDRERYEVIALASDSLDERELARIRGLLTAHDRLVRTTSAHDVAQVAEAANLARSDLLFFSESHVWPSPDVLERSLRAMEEHPEWAGLTCGSKRVVRNRVGAAEADMYERDFEIGSKQLGWRNILDQCFLTRRAAYRSSGGFDASLGHFAEWVLAARYRTEGLVVGHCPEIELLHVFTGDIGELRPFTEDFVRGEIAYLARDPATRRETLIEAPLEWSCRGDRRRDLAGHIVRLIAVETMRARKERRPANVSWRLALKRVPVVLAGGAFARMAAALEVLASRAALIAVQLDRNRSVAVAFERCMAAIIRRARLRFSDEHLAQRRPCDTGEVWNAFPDRGDAGAGLHDWEHLDDIPFRWSEPVAAIALDLSPGRYLIHVHTLWKQLAKTALRPEFFLNGKRVTGVRTSNGGNTIAFEVDVRRSGNNALGWICPATSAPEDERKLGLPLVSVLATVPSATASLTERARDAVRAAMSDLRDVLDRTPDRSTAGAARAHAEEMSRALADRDRSAAELRRQADERLAVIERVTRDAEDRLTALQQTTAAAEALREENEALRRAAQERLDLLHANARAYAELEAQVKANG